jgi:hypothetical protein
MSSAILHLIQNDNPLVYLSFSAHGVNKNKGEASNPDKGFLQNWLWMLRPYN